MHQHVQREMQHRQCRCEEDRLAEGADWVVVVVVVVVFGVLRGGGGRGRGRGEGAVGVYFCVGRGA